jgi:hypothetical protein
MAKLKNHEAKTLLKAQADIVMMDIDILWLMQETIYNKVKKAITTTLNQKEGLPYHNVSYL